MFDTQKFKQPDAVNHPGYFWFWNAPLDKKTLLEQLEDMHRMGARSVCIHPLPREFRIHLMTSMEPGYLTPEYFKLYKAVVKKCAELGMNSYLYDEGGWPSGGACGQVFASNPDEFRRRYLRLDEKGKIVVCDEQETPARATLPDVLNKKAVDKFIQLTHRAYKKCIGPHFGKTVSIAFMDEPEIGPVNFGLPYPKNIEKEFLKRKHYDITPYLKDIMRNSDVQKGIIEKRLDYYDVCSQLFVERFLLPIRDYCRENGLISGGHFGGEDEWLTTMYLSKLPHYGDIMRSLRALDAPGVDLIWRQLERAGRHHPFPKLASSAASQVGGRHVLAEMFGVYGNGLNFDEMKFLVDYMLVCGVNTFIFAAYPYSTQGSLMEGERPYFGRVNPLWKYSARLHWRTARLSAAMTNAHPVVDTALYFDVRSSWVGARTAEYAALQRLEVSMQLLNSQRDFDYVDDQVIAEGKLKNGRLCFGNASYRHLVLPANAKLSETAKNKLEEMRERGLHVIAAEQIEELPPVIRMSPSTSRLWVRKMCTGRNEVLYFVLNTSGQALDVELAADEALDVAWCNAENGLLHVVPSNGPGRWTWHFAPYDSALFLLGRHASMKLPSMPDSPGECLMELKGKWKLDVLQKYSVGRNDYEIHASNEEYSNVELGDLQGVLGSEFSGEVRYSKDFVWKESNMPSFIDLGNLSYAASVELNGVDLGQLSYAPFILPLKNALKHGRNTLKITVANTLANAIVPEEIQQRWLSEFPAVCAYELRQRDFEKEALASGLYGPVRLLDRNRTGRTRTGRKR